MTILSIENNAKASSFQKVATCGKEVGQALKTWMKSPNVMAAGVAMGVGITSAVSAANIGYGSGGMSAVEVEAAKGGLIFLATGSTIGLGLIGKGVVEDTKKLVHDVGAAFKKLGRE